MNEEQMRSLTQRMMRRQLKLSLSVAFVFVSILVGLPLINLFLPDLAKTSIAGFSLTWLILGVLFYPLTWLLSTWFVNGSEKLEAEIVREETQ